LRQTRTGERGTHDYFTGISVPKAGRHSALRLTGA
jgi:hypothetical protein